MPQNRRHAAVEIREQDVKQAATGLPRRDGFRSLLRRELARRCSRSPSYSLRAFARDLATDHSTLSQLLRGRRALTETAIRRLGKSLGLDPEAIEDYVLLERRQPPSAPDPARVEVLRELGEDMATVVAEPEHFALLELTHLEGFRPDVRWIARVLDVEIDAVGVMLQRLLRLEMLALRGREEWVDLTGDLVVPLDGTDGLEGHLLQHLAARFRAAPPGGELEYSSTVLSVDRRLVREVSARLARCRHEILALLDDDGPRDAVYRLELAFLPLTRIDDDNDHDHEWSA